MKRPPADCSAWPARPSLRLPSCSVRSLFRGSRSRKPTSAGTPGPVRGSCSSTSGSSRCRATRPDMPSTSLTQQIAMQWWGNAVGTDETAEPYLAAGLAAHAAHRLLDQTRGRNNALIGDPTGRGWLPGVGRADFRMTMVTDPDSKGTKPSGGPVADFEDPARLWGLAAERGGKVFAHAGGPHRRAGVLSAHAAARRSLSRSGFDHCRPGAGARRADGPAVGQIFPGVDLRPRRDGLGGGERRGRVET